MNKLLSVFLLCAIGVQPSFAGVLPGDLVPLDYLESVGLSWGAAVTETSETDVYGYAIDYEQVGNGSWLRVFTDQSGTCYIKNNGGWNVPGLTIRGSAVSVGSLSTRRSIIAVTNGVATVNGVQKATVSTASPLSSGSKCYQIFANPEKISAHDMRIYALSFYGNGNWTSPIAEYLPAISKTTGVIGYYDTVAGKFANTVGDLLPAPPSDGKIHVFASHGTVSVDNAAATSYASIETAVFGTVTLKATGNDGYHFCGWTSSKGIAVSRSETIEVPASESAHYVAQYGRWIYDSAAKTLTLDRGSKQWVIPVYSESGGDLTLGRGPEGAGDCDFTACFAETGYRVTRVGFNDASYGFIGSRQTSFIAPDLTIVDKQAFNGCNAMTNLVVSPDLTKFEWISMSATTALKWMTPTVFTNVLDSGVNAYPFQSNSFAEGNEITLDFPRLTSIGNSLCKSSNLAGFRATNVTTVGKSCFSGSKLKDVRLPKATSVYGSATAADAAFYNCSSLTNVVLSWEEMVSSGIGANAFRGCSALKVKPVFVAAGFTELAANAFSGCASISEVVFKSTAFAALREGSLAGIAPGAKVTFYGEPPAIENGALFCGGEATDNRLQLKTVLGKSSALWRDLVSPYATVFESYKTKPDYPGPKAMGLYLLPGTDEYAWVVEADYALAIASSTDEVGSPTPAYGIIQDMDDGEALSLSAPEGDQPVSDTYRAAFDGWTLYDVAEDGSLTSLDSAKTNAYRYVHTAGTSRKFVWDVVRKYKVAIAITGSGTLDLPGEFIAEGTELTVTATPAERYSFGGWTGALPAGAVVDGNRITFTVTGPVSFGVSFARGWEYDAASGVLSDGVNWSFGAKLVNGALTITSYIAGVGDLDLSQVSSQCGYAVDEIAQNGLAATTITSILAPDVTRVTGMTFGYSASSVTSIVLSAGLSDIGWMAFANARQVEYFYPTNLEYVTSAPGRGFAAFGKAGSAIDLNFPALMSIPRYMFSDSAVRSVTATNATNIGSGAFRNSAVRWVVTPRASVLTGGSTSGDSMDCGSFYSASAIESFVFDSRNLTTVPAYALYNVNPSLVLAFAGAAPTFAENSVKANGTPTVPMSITFDGRSRSLPGWRALAEPNANVFGSEYKTRTDFPGTANGYNTIGIVNMGTQETPVYNWLIDTRRHYGIAIIVR